MSAAIQTYENKPQLYEVSQRDILERRVALEPQLAALARLAEHTYRTLVPIAHANQEDSNYPLRFSQIQQVGELGVKHTIASSLHISLGEDHNLTIRHNEHDGHPMPWKFTRSLLIDDLLREETTIDKLALPRIGADNGRMDIDVDASVDGKREASLCSFTNNFAGAEGYIREMSSDLGLSIEHYSRELRSQY